MASKNLDKILNADEKTLKEEQDTFFEMLQTFNPREVSNLNDMRKMFEVIQKVMVFRNQHQEDEINSLRLNVKKYQDPDRLTLSEQLMLSEQLLGTDSEDIMLDTENLMKYVITSDIEDKSNLVKFPIGKYDYGFYRNTEEFSGSSNSHWELLQFTRPGKRKSSNMNLLQVDLYEMEERIRDLTEENYELHTVITNAKQITEKYYKQVLQLKKEKSELKEEKQMLRQDFIKYRRQVETQWEDLIDNMEEKMQTSAERINTLETQLIQTTEKIENLVTRFKSKRNECYRLKRELRETIKILSATRKNNVNLKTTLQSEDINNGMLRDMNEDLKSKVMALQKEQKCRNETDESIMKAVNEKVTNWKKILEDKEQMVLNLQDQVSHLRKQLRDNYKNIPDTSLITSLTAELAEKDEKIAQLTKKINFSAEIRVKNVKAIKSIQSLFQMKTINLREEVDEEKNLRYLIEKQLEDVQALVKETENHAFEKDKDLCETLKRIRQYEKNYGLDQATEEIKSLQQKVKIRDRRIEELVKLMNYYDEQLSQQMEGKGKKKNEDKKTISNK